MEPGGTSYPVFGGFPSRVAGKTGTAEQTDEEDQSWYVALAPCDDPEVVVVGDDRAGRLRRRRRGARGPRRSSDDCSGVRTSAVEESAETR